MASKDLEVQSWCVLIVDDEPDNLGVSKAILDFHGAKTYTARDGNEGLEILAQITPTIILLDLSMPCMDGWQLLKEIRVNPKTMDLPVIAVTAHAMQGDREKIMQAGFDGYIAKPFHIATFVKDIKQTLKSNGKAAYSGLQGKGL